MIGEITGPEAYLIYVWIKDIHPLLWRRFLVRSDSTLADLHQVLQIGFGWSDFHLHRFRIRKKDYAVPRLYGTSAHDARGVTLADFNFRHNERFIYEYHFGDWWRHQVRIEKRLPVEDKRTYPVCIAGRWAGPVEDCGGARHSLSAASRLPRVSSI
ncbi:MAG: plasmid pRiA4b ORF-3 family protein [Blastocatellia bacterium]